MEHINIYLPRAHMAIWNKNHLIVHPPWQLQFVGKSIHHEIKWMQDKLETHITYNMGEEPKK